MAPSAAHSRAPTTLIDRGPGSRRGRSFPQIGDIVAVSLTNSGPWPARAAYVAAAIFIGASGAMNVTYGWQRGSDMPTSVIWASVAAAVAIVFALSWPALIKALEERRLSAALIALTALVLSGAFSLSAALGSASASRTQAGTEEQNTTNARARAQAAYDGARAELDRLPPSRTVGELEALRAAAQRQPQRFDCAAVNGSMALSCPRIDGELARARQRERLAAAVDKASTDLSAVRPARVANSDAKAISKHMQAIGVDIGAERLNDLLVLLSVLMVEAGGGLALALGMALGERPRAAPAPISIPPSDRAAAAAPTSVLQEADVVAWLTQQGGKVETSIRRLAPALGRSPSAVHAELKRLVADGAIAMIAGPKGTRIALRHN